jgi:hypothetical protein
MCTMLRKYPRFKIAQTDDLPTRTTYTGINVTNRPNFPTPEYSDAQGSDSKIISA